MTTSKRFRSPITASLYALTTGERIELPQREHIFIGSESRCDVVIDDADVSPMHCAIERSGDRIAVRDLGSRRGTFVAGRRVDHTELRPGAVLRVGRRHVALLTTDRGRPTCALGHIRGRDTGLRRALETALRAAATDCSVLILGETGTGKDLVARAIHDASPRAAQPMVALNCGAISSQLIGSELFGHEKGAFTGADSARDGMFVHAAGGSLFLDELGELPMEQQPHLLRALESRTVRPIGSNRELPIDVRLIAATHRIDGMGGADSRLREDLYHRIATVVVMLPPLRRRPGDIPHLTRTFMEEFSGELGPRTITRTTLRVLMDYAWPGNIRELRCAVQRAMTLCPRELTLEHLLPHRSSRDRTAADEAAAASVARAPGPQAHMTCLSPFDLMMRDQMLDALDRWGSLRSAARALGMPKSTFADRARRLGIRAQR
ncbi:sigma 54-interacting transcriptional regulator [Haliangium sp.]|uniref:sigma 54-interacting transcriptional regulator n=1 Tax=Haliangium sp. TaxID=2663208 RepID=UPI003D1107C8